MKLVPNVRAKMRAYSIWSIMLSLALFLLPEAWLAYTGDIIQSPYLIGMAALFFGVFGVVGWFIDQTVPDLWRTFKLAVISGVLSVLIWLVLAAPSWAMEEVNDGLPPTASGLPTWDQTAVHAVPLVAKWEGMETTAYLDRIASPPVWTVCFGETFDVTPREVRTEAQCWAGLGTGLERYWGQWRRGLTVTVLHPKVDAAMTSLAWNIGVGALRGSSALRALNAGDVADACRRLTFWNKAGNRVVRGLVNRRSDEYALCMEGVV